jgi:hypothetical protein
MGIFNLSLVAQHIYRPRLALLAMRSLLVSVAASALPLVCAAASPYGQYGFGYPAMLLASDQGEFWCINEACRRCLDAEVSPTPPF